MITRRSFLRDVASGLLVAVAAPVVAAEPVRRWWQVPRNAPVRSCELPSKSQVLDQVKRDLDEHIRRSFDPYDGRTVVAVPQYVGGKIAGHAYHHVSSAAEAEALLGKGSPMANLIRELELAGKVGARAPQITAIRIGGQVLPVKGATFQVGGRVRG